MRKFLALILLLPLTICSSVALAEEDLDKIFQKVKDLKAAGKYPQAINELGWAQKQLNQLNANKLKSFLPDELAGFKGDSSKANAVLGMTAIERNYSKSNVKVKVSLTGGSSSGMGAGLAGFGQMAALMGGSQAGLNSFRLDGQTANLMVNEQRKHAELTVFLQSGSIVKLEMRNSADGETLKKLAETLNVGKIEEYLKGTS